MKAEPTKDEIAKQGIIKVEQLRKRAECDECTYRLYCLEENKPNPSPPSDAALREGVMSETELITELCDAIKKSVTLETSYEDGAPYQEIEFDWKKLEQAARNLLKNYKSIILAEWIEGEKKRTDILLTLNKKAEKETEQKTASAIKEKLEMVCKFRSEIPMVEIGRENLTSDIDNEVMPIINEFIEGKKKHLPKAVMATDAAKLSNKEEAK